MKSDQEIKKMILDFARSKEDIRAVLLEGSRSNPTIKSDPFQDFDIVFAVDNFSEFINDGSWTNHFGEILIEQQPETFSFGEKQDNFFSYLVMYKEGFRIDFSIIPAEKIADFKESLQNVWLDKDGIFKDHPAASDIDFWVKKPNEKFFQEVCNEFWWVSTYVAKGLARNEIPYAVHHFENVLRPMQMQMLDWKIGLENNFRVSSGKLGRFYPKYLPPELHQQFLQTYGTTNIEQIWESLFVMANIFRETAKEIAGKMEFYYKVEEEINVFSFLTMMRNSQ